MTLLWRTVHNGLVYYRCVKFIDRVIHIYACVSQT